ncbi:MAG: hypothetical protein ACYTHJ_13410 [Planctomycetota bacterium]
MKARRRSQAARLAIAGIGVIAWTGCAASSERAMLLQKNRELRDENAKLNRQLVANEERTRALQLRVDTLTGSSADQPSDLFSPTKLRFASLSGGADYDGEPGDDGITVYVQPVDADGEVVKAPGRLRVQLLDNSDLANPRVLGTYAISDPDELRKSWYGRFGTRHYTLKCPFPEGTSLPPSGKVNVAVEFVDFQTGRTLTATEEMTFAPRPK